MSERRTSPWLIVLVVLVGLNTLLSVLILLTLNSSRQIDNLPSLAVAESFGQKVIELYNNQSVSQLYALYHPMAQAKLSEADLESQLNKLHELFGPLSRLSYSSSSKLGEQGAMVYYEFRYTAAAGKPGLGPATVVLHVVAQEGKSSERFALYGMRINAGQKL